MAEYVGMFWMVMADNSSHTRYRHRGLDDARREAERLALLNPGVKFYVLQCVGAAEAHQPIEWRDAVDEIPF